MSLSKKESHPFAENLVERLVCKIQWDGKVAVQDITKKSQVFEQSNGMFYTVNTSTGIYSINDRSYTVKSDQIEGINKSPYDIIDSSLQSWNKEYLRFLIDWHAIWNDDGIINRFGV